MPRRRGLAHSLADTLVRSGERTMTVDHAVDEFRAELMAPGRILLIDDEQAIRAAIGRALIAEGHAVDFADTGSDGLGQALGQSYDLVILDLLMPDTDGCSVLRQLLRERPAQAVMVLSCLADVNCKVDCLELGARELMEHAGQSVSKGRLLETVQRWCPTAPRRWQLGPLDPVTVRADLERLGLAVDALLENAVRHTSEDDVIEMSVIRGEAGPVCLIVSDTVIAVFVGGRGAGRIGPHGDQRVVAVVVGRGDPGGHRVRARPGQAYLLRPDQDGDLARLGRLQAGVDAVAAECRGHPGSVPCARQQVGGPDEGGGFRVGRALVELPRGVGLDDQAVAQDRDVVRRGQRLVLVVGDEHGGGAGRPQDRQDPAADAGAQPRVE
jgi:CheY-like chemotaxis protein